MSEPTTGKSAMSADDINRIIKAIESGNGASVNIQDPRVSQVQTWLIGLFGLGMVSSALWLANSVNDLKMLAVRQTTIMEQMEHRITKLEDRKP